MLHIHSGDAVADALRDGRVHGQHIVWTDLLMCGPLRPQLGYATFVSDRARTLSAATGGARPPDLCEAFLRKQDDRLTLWEGHDETVLWVDACLYDQTILARLLAWFARLPEALSRLSLICVESHPAVAQFHGLGQLSPAQLEALLPSRSPVSREQADQGNRTWTAMCNPAPREIQCLSRETNPPMPWMTQAMRRWLEQFPSTRNGLDRLQREILASLDDSIPVTPVALFTRLSSLDRPAFFGDSFVWKYLNDMAFCKHPLIRLKPEEALPLWNPGDLARRGLTRTATGTAVMQGDSDAIALNGIDRWIGGAHLQGAQRSPWRWDLATTTLQQCES